MNIHYKIKTISIFLLLQLVISLPLMSQQLWPGDVNNNGVVNGVDWIFISKAFEEFGPPREVGEMGIEWEAKSIATLWGTTFPGTTTDYSYADCNGDGFVDGLDLEAIDLNFMEEHGVVEDDVAVSGAPGTDPELFFEDFAIDLFPQGGVLFLELSLGTADMPVESFSGISFSLEYDPEVVLDIFFMPPEEGDAGWADFNLFLYQRNLPDEGRIEFAFSSFDAPVEEASGLLGRLFIVIEDDVVDWEGQEVETMFNLENVILFGEDLLVADPVVNDTIMVTIVEDPLSTDNFIDQDEVDISPNPASDHLYLKTSHKIEAVEILNVIGQKLQSFKIDAIGPQKLDLSEQELGVYFVKVYLEEGILTKKVLLY